MDAARGKEFILVATTGWRVVLFTVGPIFPPLVEGILRECGHRLIGLVTAPAGRQTPHVTLIGASV